MMVQQHTDNNTADTSNLNDYDNISQEEIVANVLHILSSHTKTTPLTCKCTWGNNNSYATAIVGTKHESDAGVSWDPFKSLLSDDNNMLHDEEEMDGTHVNFPWYWLDAFASQCKVMSRGARWNTSNANEEKLMQIKSVFIDTNQLNKVVLNDDRPTDDDLLWQVGIGLLKTHLFVKSDMNEDKNDTIPPHELLRVVMDSYYCNDNDEDFDMIFSGVEMPTNEDVDVAIPPEEQMYRVPTSIGMFYLRTVLVCLALQNAKKSIIDLEKSCKPIRWRRLRSLVDESISLFQRMLLDHVGKAVDNFEHGTHPKSMKLYPIEPSHIIEMSSWLYTQHVFPSCKDLLLKILFNEANNGNNKGTSSEVKVLESCYNSIRMLTNLLAMDVTLVDNANPSSLSVKLILKCIENYDKSQFFHQVRLAQKRITPSKETSDEDLSGGDESENDMYQPWNDRCASNFQVIGLSLEEDLLLQPLIRKIYENSDRVNSNTFFDEIGIALITYWKLCEQSQSSREIDTDPIRSPSTSNSFCWTLIFPHIITFLCAMSSSSTIERMDELELISSSDEYLLGMNLAIYSLGFDMLHMLITKLKAIRPSNSNEDDLLATVDQWAYSAQGLHSTIAVLLSHVVRISSLEASLGNHSHSDVYPALKYSSLEVMDMARKLLGFYSPTVQIETLLLVCQNVKQNQDRVILPRALDFMRPLIMKMCSNIERHTDCKVMLQISQLLDIFLLDLYDEFDVDEENNYEAISPLPKDVGEFMSMTETYSAVFAILRLQQMWISRCQTEEKVADKMALQTFGAIVEWMDDCLSELHSFGKTLAVFIAFCENTAEPPQDWHLLYLLELALRDVIQTNK